MTKLPSSCMSAEVAASPSAELYMVLAVVPFGCTTTRFPAEVNWIWEFGSTGGERYHASVISEILPNHIPTRKRPLGRWRNPNSKSPEGDFHVEFDPAVMLVFGCTMAWNPFRSESSMKMEGRKIGKDIGFA